MARFGILDSFDDLGIGDIGGLKIVEAGDELGLGPGAGVVLAAGALAIIFAQHEHQQAVVMHDAATDQLAALHDRQDRAVDGAIEGELAQRGDAGDDRLGPAVAEGGAIGMETEAIGGGRSHADGVAGALDRAGDGEVLEELALAGDRPAARADAARSGGRGEGLGQPGC